MLIRASLLAPVAALVLAACATESDPITSTDEDGLTCDPFCDPGDYSYEAARDGAYNYGFAMFSDGLPANLSCVDLDPLWDCTVTFTTKASSTGCALVECVDSPVHQRHRVKCNAATTAARNCD